MKLNNQRIKICLLFLLLTINTSQIERKRQKVQKKKVEKLEKRYRNIYDKKCELKSGIIGYAIEFTNSENSKNEQEYLVGIKQRSVLVEMNPEKLVVKNKNERQQLFKEIRMNDIQFINVPQIWDKESIKVKCIQIVSNEKSSLLKIEMQRSQEPIEIYKTDVNLCFNNVEQRNDWIRSIIEMKECKRESIVKELKEQEMKSRMKRRNEELSKKVDSIEEELKKRKEQKEKDLLIRTLQLSLKRLHSQSQIISSQLHLTHPHLLKEANLNYQIQQIHPQFDQIKAHTQKTTQLSQLIDQFHQYRFNKYSKKNQPSIQEQQQLLNHEIDQQDISQQRNFHQQYFNHNSEEDDLTISEHEQLDQKYSEEQEDDEELYKIKSENKLTQQEKEYFYKLIGKIPAKSKIIKKSKFIKNRRFKKKLIQTDQEIDVQINELIQQLSRK